MEPLNDCGFYFPYLVKAVYFVCRPPKRFEQRLIAMSNPISSPASDPGFEPTWRSLAASRWMPLTLLALGTASNLRYAHAPLVAFAVASGVMLKRRQALSVALLIWLVNQTIGFYLRGYPLSTTAFTWGALMGVGTLTVVGVASCRPAFAQKTLGGHMLWSVTAVVVGFCLYQGLILLAYPLLADGHLMGWDIVAKLFMKQALWSAALLCGHSLLLWPKLVLPYSSKLKA